MDTPELLEGRMLAAIGALAASPETCARSPGRDFTRSRKLPLGELLRMLVVMGAGTLGVELGRCLRGGPPPSASAFSQQRAKLEPGALRRLLLDFDPLPDRGLWRGEFTLAAIDGTEVVMQRNPRDAVTHVARGNGRSERGYNSMYATASYDLANGIWLDADVRPGPEKDEHAAFRLLVRRWAGPGRLLAVADRGFASYNAFANCIEAGAAFVIRLSDGFARGLLGADGLPDELDRDVSLSLSRSRSAAARALPGHRHLAGRVRFDFLPEGRLAYGMRLRVVRFPLGGGRFENLATNLPRSGFGAGDLREVYSMRWGVETSFRRLKHAVGLSMLHSATARGVEQEVYARMVLYNFCSAMAAMAGALVERREGLKWERAVSFADAVRACRDFLLRERDGPPGGVLGLIAASTCPIRPGRKYARHKRAWTPASLAYRC